MKFILIADDENTPNAFFPFWKIIIFVMVTIIVLILLFPKTLLQEVLADNRPAAVKLSYLKSFSRNNPNNPLLIFYLIEQEIEMGQITEANNEIEHFKKISSQEDIKSQLMWIDYLLLRYRSYKAKMNSPERIADLKKMREMSSTLINMNLDQHQLRILAWDNISLGNANVALKIYTDLMNTNQLHTPQEFAEGGSVAMQNNSHRESSAFYWAAYHKEIYIIQKRQYAVDAIKALWAGNYVNEALSLASQLPPIMLNDRDLLLLLSRLALAANKPDLAQDYAIQALLLNQKKTHE